MSRILELRGMLDAKTEKEKWERNYFLFKYEDTIKEELDTLEKLENFGEKIGCPLDVLTTISEHGFYYEYGYIPPYRINRIDIFRKEIVFCDEEKDWFSVKLSDHNKTWWLTEEEWRECVTRNTI